MVKAENFIVHGKCFLYSEDPAEIITNFKRLLSEYMLKHGYLSQDMLNPFSNNPFLCMTFTLPHQTKNMKLVTRIKMKLGLTDEREHKQNIYFSWLSSRTDDAILDVTFILTPSEHNNKKGVEIEIYTRPALLYKINQLKMKYEHNELEYSMIIRNNHEFIYEVMRAFNSTITEPPKVLSDISSEVYTNPIIDKLEKLNFLNIAKIMSDGLQKLNQGKVKESLDELRSAIEIFTKLMADRVSDKSHPQDKIESNLDILKQKGYLNDNLAGILIAVYHNKLYSFISDTVTHKREDVHIKDGEFIYSLVQNYFDYLINKVVL